MLNFNKSLFKRVIKLPNVSEFVALKTGLHEYALMYGLEKVTRISRAIKLYESDKANKYLEHQARRLSKYAANREMEKFDALSQLILRRSKTMRLLALNRVLPDWFSLPMHKLKGLWKRLSKLCWNLKSDLKFKRVWIDKKPGDFARPLGVPTIEWRAFSFMRLDHMERALKGMGILQDFQHGGRSGKGVLSCWESLIPRLKSSKFIYEFDLKGFFDNVNHNAILRIIAPLGLELFSWTSNILKAKPISYVMPPIEEDKAIQNIEKFRLEHALENEMFGDYPDLIIPDTEFEILSGTEADKLLASGEAEIGYFWNDVEPKFVNGKLMMVQKLGDSDSFADLSKSVIGNYGEAMEGQLYSNPLESYFKSTRVKETKPMDREIGRDRWKNLGIEGKGVPQGLGTSPLLSTILTDTYLKSLRNNILMYMDDGLLFAETKSEMNNLIIKMKNQCKAFGVEIAEEKSGLIKEDGTWVKSSRFLGLRYIPERDTITSDTRSGTTMEFPARSSWKEIEQIVKAEKLNVSDTKRKFDQMLHLKAYEAGLKHGFLGCLISESQYKDLKTLDERRMDILLGQMRSWSKLAKSSSGFIWKYQDMIEVKTNLTNASSISVYKFLRFIRRRGKFGWR